MKQQPPEDASLEGHRHGDTVSEQTALHLASLPDSPKDWVILPSTDGLTLTLAWGDSCTLEDLRRVNGWIRRQTADLRANGQPRGDA